ncbi:MAG: diacylglycerol kinase family protein [Acidimicrobiales bacterium]
MTEPDLVHFLARPEAGGPRAAALTKATDAATALGFRHRVLTAASPSEIPAVIDEHRAELHRLVIVGGDGLIHFALPALAGTSITAGLVPSGTGNDFARGLGIGEGHKLPAARHRSVLRQAILGDPKSIDLIEGDDGRLAASVVTAGFSGRVTARANPMRFPPGQAKYTVATVLEAARLEPVAVRFTIDGESVDLDTAFFAIGNTRYFGGGMAICPDAEEDDGLLDLVVVEAVPAFELLRVMPTVFAGRHVRHPKVKTYRARSVRVETDEPLWADGEEFGSAPVTLAARPGALAVAQPVG